MEAGRAPHVICTTWRKLHGTPAAVDGWRLYTCQIWSG